MSETALPTPATAVLQPRPHITASEVQEWCDRITPQLATWTPYEQEAGKTFYPTRKGEKPCWGTLTPDEMELIAQPLRGLGWNVTVVEGYMMDVGGLGTYELCILTPQRAAILEQEWQARRRSSRNFRLGMLAVVTVATLIYFLSR